MQETTNDTSARMPEDGNGSPKNKELRPWEIAAKLLPIGSGQTVDVEHATDAQFQAWVLASKLDQLVDENGIAEWSFDDRIRLINYALRQGIALPFAVANNSESRTDSELFADDKPASQAV